MNAYIGTMKKYLNKTSMLVMLSVVFATTIVLAQENNEESWLEDADAVIIRDDHEFDTAVHQFPEFPGVFDLLFHCVTEQRAKFLLLGHVLRLEIPVYARDPGCNVPAGHKPCLQGAQADVLVKDHVAVTERSLCPVEFGGQN